jgi:hypothetical protein
MRLWCLPGCCLGLLSAQAPCRRRAWGTQQAVNDMLVAYCTGLENAVLGIGDEIEAMSDEPEA